MFICSELVKETGRPPGLYFNALKSTLFHLYRMMKDEDNTILWTPLEIITSLQKNGSF